MAVFSDALVMHIRGDSSHLLAELERSRLALAALRREFQQFQQEQVAAVNRGAVVTNRAGFAVPRMAHGGFVSAARAVRRGGMGSLSALGIANPARAGKPPMPPDRVPALLSAGEFVMSRRAVERLGVQFMERLNAQRFQDGGLVRSVSDPFTSRLPGSALTFGPFPTTQQGRLRFLGLDALPNLLDEALRLFDLGRRTGDPSFLRLGFPIQQTLANFRLLLSDRNRQSALGVLSPLESELRRRPDALRAVLSLIGSTELKLALLRLLGFENPQAGLAGLLGRETTSSQGSGTEVDPFRIEPASASQRSGGMGGLSALVGTGGSSSGQAPALITTNHFGGIHVNVRGAAGVGEVLRQLRRQGVTGRLRRGG